MAAAAAATFHHATSQDATNELSKTPKRTRNILTMGTTLLPRKPTYQQITNLADTCNPDKALQIIIETPALANTNMSQDPYGFELAISDLVKMEGVQLRHVEGVYKRMTRWSRHRLLLLLPSDLLHDACLAGCENDIILYLIKQNPSSARKKDTDDNIPFFYLLGTAIGAEHLPSLEKLLALAASKVKKDIPKYIQKVHTNKNCPQEILDKLMDLSQGQ